VRAVRRVAHDRVPDVREVHPDLMRAARLQLGAQQVRGRPAGERRSRVTRAPPAATTAMRLRSVRERPIGASTV
jgi:hypothetical protein